MKITKRQLKRIIKEELEKGFEAEKRDPDILTPEEIKDLLKLAQPQPEDQVNLDILTPEEIEDYQYKNVFLRRAVRKMLANWPREERV